MGPIGFSTGALAYSDFGRGLAIVRSHRLRAVELSALRENELAPLVDALDSLDLSNLRYISVHAPSRYDASSESRIIDLLKHVTARNWPIILHPDTIYDFSAWAFFGGLLFIENMDKRNQVGRTAQELYSIFRKLPHAGLCLDLGHCRQVDSTMNEAHLILRDFGTRLKQLHVSEVNSRSTHDPLSCASIGAFSKISHLIPLNVPVILESPVEETMVETEVEHARIALSLPASSNGAAELRAKSSRDCVPT